MRLRRRFALSVYVLVVSSTVGERIQYEAEPSKGSRFIATVAPAANEDSAKEHLARVRAEMPDAGHHCWAWRIAQPVIDRASDDGEPSGSAGKPILAQLTGRDLVNTAVIVSRYWGGTKLGVGGLVRAYGGAAAEALDRATLLPWVAMFRATVRHEHGDTDAVIRALTKAGAVDIDADYGTAVTRIIELPVDAADQVQVALADATAGRAVIEAETP